MFDDAMNASKVGFQKALDHMKSEFSKLQIGRASSGLVDNLNVDMYGSSQPLKAVASISVPDATTLQIQPWDKGALRAIEKAIVDSNTGLNPVNTGVAIMINMPPMTEERRAEVAKQVRVLSEDAKIAIRNTRQEAIAEFKKMKDSNEMTEDDLRSSEKKLQESVDSFNKLVEESSKSKEHDIMTV